MLSGLLPLALGCRLLRAALFLFAMPGPAGSGLFFRERPVARVQMPEDGDDRDDHGDDEEAIECRCGYVHVD